MDRGIVCLLASISIERHCSGMITGSAAGGHVAPPRLASPRVGVTGRGQVSILFT